MVHWRISIQTKEIEFQVRNEKAKAENFSTDTCTSKNEFISHKNHIHLPQFKTQSKRYFSLCLKSLGNALWFPIKRKNFKILNI